MRNQIAGTGHEEKKGPRSVLAHYPFYKRQTKSDQKRPERTESFSPFSLLGFSNFSGVFPSPHDGATSNDTRAQLPPEGASFAFFHPS